MRNQVVETNNIMVERYSPDKSMEATKDAVKLIAGVALLAFAFILMFLSVPLRGE